MKTLRVTQRGRERGAEVHRSEEGCLRDTQNHTDTERWNHRERSRDLSRSKCGADRIRMTHFFCVQF